MIDCQVVTTVEGLDQMVEELVGQGVIACDTETDGLDVVRAKLEGIGVGTGKKQFYIPFPSEVGRVEIINRLRYLFLNNEVVFHNAKFDLEVLTLNGFTIPKNFHDTMLMSWLLDEEGVHGLKQLTQLYLKRETEKWKGVNRQTDMFRSEQEVWEAMAKYCGADVCNTYDLYFYFKPLVMQEKLLIDYERVELPLVKVLAGMELRGIKLDKDWLEQKKVEAELALESLREMLQESVGERQVNYQSSRQLESFLYDVLGYKAVKLTASGHRSTDDESLEMLIKKNKLKEDSFVVLLLKYRELDKLYKTYFLSLLKQVGEDGVVHTSFLQHGTRTGRLSSVDPNLQNIPVRDDVWNVRQAFIPRSGYSFIIADYSQIELRMLAHFSGDEKMVQTFKDGGDIHAQTMAVTGLDRRQAKAINFGLIYGMGSRSLAKDLGVSEKEASEYIAKFFSGYPGVRSFITKVQKQAMNNGFVMLLTGRKRRFLNMKDSKWFGSIQRQAINSKVQGSAADLIKIAMIKLGQVLRSYNAYLLLQIHDEVVIECPVEKVVEVQTEVAKVMEEAVSLSVPLKVSITTSNHWIKS